MPPICLRYQMPGRELHCKHLHGLEARVLQTNPILESFGNAMTTRTGILCPRPWVKVAKWHPLLVLA